MLRDILDALGLNPSILIAGGAGGLLRALSAKRHTLRERIVSPVAGALAAGYLTAAIVHYAKTLSVPLPEDPAVSIGAVGFLVGVSAMWISDALMVVVLQRLQRSA